MKKHNIYIIFVLIFTVACTQKSPKKHAIIISQAEEELLKRSQGIFSALPDRAENPENLITAEKVKLGKILFFDTRLSKTGNNSCNSCHNLSTFGVDNLTVSKGDAGKFGVRNSPTVLNAAFHTMQFWDGRAKDVEEQASGHILNPAEMAIPTKDFLVTKLNGIQEYVDLFEQAFPSDKQALTFLNIQKSIAAFERTLVTPSHFDNYLKGDFGALTPSEIEGLQTYIDVGCIQCHTGVALGGSTFQKFGVYGDYRTYTKSQSNDEGRKMITKLDSDKDIFKVPTLRNVEKTAPYFHDGSVAELNDAVKIMGKAQLNKDLSDSQVNSIVAFLKSVSGDISEDVKKAPEILVQK